MSSCIANTAEGFVPVFEMDDLTARFTHAIINESLTIELATAYRDRCRMAGDFKTADWLRDWLRAQNTRVRDARLSTLDPRPSTPP